MTQTHSRKGLLTKITSSQISLSKHFMAQLKDLLSFPNQKTKQAPSCREWRAKRTLRWKINQGQTWKKSRKNLPNHWLLLGVKLLQRGKCHSHQRMHFRKSQLDLIRPSLNASHVKTELLTNLRWWMTSQRSIKVHRKLYSQKIKRPKSKRRNQVPKTKTSMPIRLPKGSKNGARITKKISCKALWRLTKKISRILKIWVNTATRSTNVC